MQTGEALSVLMLLLCTHDIVRLQGAATAAAGFPYLPELFSLALYGCNSDAHSYHTNEGTPVEALISRRCGWPKMPICLKLGFCNGNTCTNMACASSACCCAMARQAEQLQIITTFSISYAYMPLFSSIQSTIGHCSTHSSEKSNIIPHRNSES